MQDERTITAEALAARITAKPSPAKRLVARLTLCASLAVGGTAQADEASDLSSAYNSGYAAGVTYADTGLINGSTSVDPSQVAAFNEGFHDALCDLGLYSEAESRGGAPCDDGSCGCADGSSGCGCGCGD
jgi:hypothetical protein